MAMREAFLMVALLPHLESESAVGVGVAVGEVCFGLILTHPAKSSVPPAPVACVGHGAQSWVGGVQGS